MAFLCHGAGERIQGYIHQISGVGVGLQAFHTHAGDGGLGDHLVGIGGGFHRHVHEGFSRCYRRGANGGKRRTHGSGYAFDNRTELLEFVTGGIRVVPGLLELITEIIRLFPSVTQLFSHIIQSLAW